MNSDYIFLFRAEPNFLSRLIFFELENILDFIGIIPPLITGPIALVFSAVLVVYTLYGKINFWLIAGFTGSMVALVIFLLNYFNGRVTIARDKYSTT